MIVGVVVSIDPRCVADFALRRSWLVASQQTRSFSVIGKIRIVDCDWLLGASVGHSWTNPFATDPVCFIIYLRAT